MISPPTALEESEMAMFVQVESERRRKQQEATGYSPAAKLRELRKDMGGSVAAEGGASSSSMDPDAGRGGAPSHGRPDNSEQERRKAERAAERARSRRAAQASSEAADDEATVAARREGGTSGGSPFGQRAAAVARSLSRSLSGSSPPFGRRPKQRQKPPPMQKQASASGVQGLKERRQREANDQKAREAKRGQADRLLASWHERHRGDVYAMMSSTKLFTDLFPSGDPLAGKPIPRGDAHALKKAWHKLAAKLHPDRQQDANTATQVLAEEVFKALTMAYTKEVERIEKANSGHLGRV